MYTQCPECLAVYEIDEEALQASLGIVRCGHCSTRFDALRTLTDALPAAPRNIWPDQDPSARAPILAEEVSPPGLQPAAEDPKAGIAGTKPVERGAPAGAQAGGNTDDWFTDIESELAATSDTRTSGGSEPNPNDEGDWAVELPDAISAAGPATKAAENRGAGNDPAGAASATETPEGLAAEDTDTHPESLSEAHEAAVIMQPDLVLDPDSDPYESGSASPTSTSESNPTEDPYAATAAAPAAAEMEPSTAGSDVSTTLAPVYVRPRRRFSRLGLAWASGCVLLALLLAAQLAWADRVKLFRNPATRGWMVRLCAHVPCQLPLIKDTAKLELLSRDVRPDPEATGALTITATLRNDAAFGQPWPVVVVKFTDLDDNPVAMRRFRPAEYMPDSARRAAGIAPGETAAVAFEVIDPGRRATGFQFGFE
ncbi:MAG: DUF3426 domain-containing protein [Rhodanobacteraceae bacterium]